MMTKLSPYCSSVLLIYIYQDHTSLCVTFAFFQVYIQLMRGQRSNSAIRSTKWALRPAHSAVVAQMRKLSENVKGQVSLAGRFYRLNRSIDGGMAEGDQCAGDVNCISPDGFWDQSTQKGACDLLLLWTLELLTFSSSLTFCEAQSWLCVLFFAINVFSISCFVFFIITLYTQKVKLKYFCLWVTALCILLSSNEII